MSYLSILEGRNAHRSLKNYDASKRFSFGIINKQIDRQTIVTVCQVGCRGGFPLSFSTSAPAQNKIFQQGTTATILQWCWKGGTFSLLRFLVPSSVVRFINPFTLIVSKYPPFRLPRLVVMATIFKRNLRERISCLSLRIPYRPPPLPWDSKFYYGDIKRTTLWGAITF